MSWYIKYSPNPTNCTIYKRNVRADSCGELGHCVCYLYVTQFTFDGIRPIVELNSLNAVNKKCFIAPYTMRIIKDVNATKCSLTISSDDTLTEIDPAIEIEKALPTNTDTGLLSKASICEYTLNYIKS